MLSMDIRFTANRFKYKSQTVQHKDSCRFLSVRGVIYTGKIRYAGMIPNYRRDRKHTPFQKTGKFNPHTQTGGTRVRVPVHPVQLRPRPPLPCPPYPSQKHELRHA